MSSPTEHFSNGLASARKERKLSQKRLAEIVTAGGTKIHQTTIAKLETGERTRIEIDEALAICAALDVSPARLLAPHGEKVRVTNELVVSAEAFRGWIGGNLEHLSEEDVDRGGALDKSKAAETEAALREAVQLLSKVVEGTPGVSAGTAIATQELAERMRTEYVKPNRSGDSTDDAGEG